MPIEHKNQNASESGNAAKRLASSSLRFQLDASSAQRFALLKFQEPRFTLAVSHPRNKLTLFFPIPDGSAILYNLIGYSKPPLPMETINASLKAKQNFIQILKIKNWLKTTQRLNVVWNFEQEDPSIFVNGANTIDIPGEATKDYKLSIYGLKQSAAKLSVFFKNLQTQEFIYYKLVVAIQPADIVAKIELVSIVRETVSKLITIENPLSTPVIIKPEYFTCETDVVNFNPKSFTIPQKSEFGYEVLFRPLLANELQSKYILKSPELGDFAYNLQLKGLPQTTSRSLTFKTTLGSDIIQTFKFQNYVKKAIQYTCKIEKLGNDLKPISIEQDAKGGKGGAKVDMQDFTLEVANNIINAPAADSYDGVEVGVNIKFEPSSLSEFKSLITISSPEGGEYTCILYGQTLSPQPKGPFKLSGAKPPTIDFKNPFFDAQEFIIRIDNPSFTTSVKSPVKIDGKKVLNIAVVYKAVPNTSNNGRLMISTGDLPPWIFYLQGE